MEASKPTVPQCVACCQCDLRNHWPTWRGIADRTLRARVAPSRYDPLDPDRWWVNTDHAQAVLHELAALVNVWFGAGFRPDGA